MILANIEAAIEAKEKERDITYNDLKYVDNLIQQLNDIKHELLDRDTDLYYEIEELKEQLNNEL